MSHVSSVSLLSSFKHVSSCLGDGTAIIQPHPGARVHGPSSPHGLKVIGMFWNYK